MKYNYCRAFEIGRVRGMAKLAVAGLKATKPDSAYDPEQLGKGIKVETEEHSDNPEIAKAIAKHHLSELPDYYDRLEEMEEEGKKELGIKEKGEKPEPKTNPVDRGIAKGAIKAFLLKNPKPKDEQIHELAEGLGYEPDKFEEIVYELLSESLKK